MLARTVEERDCVARQVGEVLDWAGHSGLITMDQRDILLAEIVRRVKSQDNERNLISSYSFNRSSQI